MLSLRRAFGLPSATENSPLAPLNVSVTPSSRFSRSAFGVQLLDGDALLIWIERGGTRLCEQQRTFAFAIEPNIEQPGSAPSAPTLQDLQQFEVDRVAAARFEEGPAGDARSGTFLTPIRDTARVFLRAAARQVGESR